MKQEISAGAVIIRNKAGIWEVLLIRDMKGTLTFPKGFIEDGENIKETAVREAQEETGISGLRYLADLPDVSYFYTRDGQSIRKQVHYQLFVSEKDVALTPQTEEGITEILWMPMEQAIACIGYEKSNQPILLAAHAYILQHKKEQHI